MDEWIDRQLDVRCIHRFMNNGWMDGWINYKWMEG